MGEEQRRPENAHRAAEKERQSRVGLGWPIEREQLLGHTSEQHATEVILPMEGYE
jgi:hypothetical protein